LSNEDVVEVRLWAKRYAKPKQINSIPKVSDGEIAPWFTDEYFIIPLTTTNAGDGKGKSGEIRFGWPAEKSLEGGFMSNIVLDQDSFPDDWFRKEFFNELTWEKYLTQKGKPSKEHPNGEQCHIDVEIHLDENNTFENNLRIIHVPDIGTTPGQPTKLKLGGGTYRGGKNDKGWKVGDKLSAPDMWDVNVNPHDVAIFYKIKDRENWFGIKIVRSQKELIDYMENELYVGDFSKAF